MGYPIMKQYEPLILGGPLAPDLAPPKHKRETGILNHVLFARGYKWCGGCASALPLAAFSTNAAKHHGLNTRCRHCNSASRDAEQNRSRHLRRTYGITADEYAALLDAQGGVCAICGGPPTPTPRNKHLCLLYVDHDHATGAVRALLCYACNQGLGSFRDSPETRMKAARYILEHDALHADR